MNFDQSEIDNLDELKISENSIQLLDLLLSKYNYSYYIQPSIFFSNTFNLLLNLIDDDLSSRGLITPIPIKIFDLYFYNVNSEFGGNVDIYDEEGHIILPTGRKLTPIEKINIDINYYKNKFKNYLEKQALKRKEEKENKEKRKKWEKSFGKNKKIEIIRGDIPNQSNQNALNAYNLLINSPVDYSQEKTLLNDEEPIYDNKKPIYDNKEPIYETVKPLNKSNNNINDINKINNISNVNNINDINNKIEIKNLKNNKIDNFDYYNLRDNFNLDIIDNNYDNYLLSLKNSLKNHIIKENIYVNIVYEIYKLYLKSFKITSYDIEFIYDKILDQIFTYSVSNISYWRVFYISSEINQNNKYFFNQFKFDQDEVINKDETGFQNESDMISNLLYDNYLKIRNTKDTKDIINNSFKEYYYYLRHNQYKTDLIAEKYEFIVSFIYCFDYYLKDFKIDFPSLIENTLVRKKIFYTVFNTKTDIERINNLLKKNVGVELKYLYREKLGFKHLITYLNTLLNLKHEYKFKLFKKDINNASNNTLNKTTNYIIYDKTLNLIGIYLHKLSEDDYENNTLILFSLEKINNDNQITLTLNNYLILSDDYIYKKSSFIDKNLKYYYDQLLPSTMIINDFVLNNKTKNRKTIFYLFILNFSQIIENIGIDNIKYLYNAITLKDNKIILDEIDSIFFDKNTYSKNHQSYLKRHNFVINEFVDKWKSIIKE